MDDDFYCKVYLQSGLDNVALKALIGTISSGRVEGRTIETSDMQIDVFENRPAGQSTGPDDFVRWPYYLEIEGINNRSVRLDSFVAKLAELLVGLRANGIRSVASCDFEEQLARAMA